MPRFARRAAGRLALLLAAAAAAAPGTARGQPAFTHPRELGSLGVDTASLATGPYARMVGLLERTIFQLNVATAAVRVGPATASRLQELARGRSGDQAPRDSLAAAVIRSRNALIRIHFHRHVGYGRFLGELRKDLRRARDAGIVSAAHYDTVAASLPDWYDFLEERGVREGDEMIYRIRGDTLRTLYVTSTGEKLLDQVDVGAFRRRAVLGGYFAPETSFREPLLRSLMEPE